MNEERACERVDEHMADVLDGTAPDGLYDHLAECDRCRDARHAAESASELVRRAASDHVTAPNLSERVLAELDRHAGDRAHAANGAAAPVSAATAEPVREEPKAPAARAEDQAPGRDVSAPVRAARVPARGARRQAIGIAVAIAALGGAALWAGNRPPVEPGGASDDGWHGSVQQVVTVHGGRNALQVCAADGRSCRNLAVGEAVERGVLLRTDARTRARVQLEDGTSVTLDRETELLLDDSAPRRAALRRGALLADVAHVANRPAQITVPLGHVAVLGTKFALRATAESVSVDVSRGAVQLVDRGQRSVTVRAGEEGRLEGSAPPLVSPALALGEVLSMSEAERTSGDAVLVRALGELKAKKPGQQQELAGAVQLSTHRVKVRIAGAVARTEVDEVFTNTTGDVLEGIYRFPMPPDAQIERLALEVDGKLEEGAFVERDRAAAIWRGAIVNAAPSSRKLVRDEIVWVPGPWKDPALLEWQRGGRFELRIFPIPKRGSRRVVLTYTQVLKPTAGVRRYSYPLAHDPSGSTRVADFSLDVQVVGHDAAFGVRSHGYELSRADGAASAERLAYSARDFEPAGDLHVEYALPNRGSEVTAWGYRAPSGLEAPVARSAGAALAAPHEARSGGYVAIALRPELPRSSDSGQRAFVLIVDTSRSLFGESYKRASALAVRTIAELDPGDRVGLLACDSECRELPGGLRAPGTELAREAERFLGNIVPEGASDITRGLGRARALAETSRERALRVVYIGDGSATVGPVRPSSIENAVRRAVPPELGTVTAVAVGADSDVDTLAALARGGGGAVVPYVPGQSASRVAYSVLGATYGSALRDVRVELPAGLEQIAPQQLDSLLAGSEALVVARTERAQLDGELVLRGRLGKSQFERRYPLKVQLAESKGNAFVPRLFAATRIVDLERDGSPLAKTEAVRLSKSFDVASRYTSLLVLESPAMFKAFGLDNRRHAPEFDAEELAVASESSSAETLAAAKDSSALELDALNTYGDDARGRGMASGGGLSSLGRAASTAAPAAAAPPSPAPAPKAAAPRRSQAAPAERAEAEKKRESRPLIVAEEEPWQRPRPGMIPMRRIWQRKGEVLPDRVTPKFASFTELARVEALHRNEPNRREHVKKLYVLSTVTGDLARARELAETWSSKEPLDPEALTARADLAAQAGDRTLAIRILGSVLDVRPYDGKARERLARLQRWSGEPLLACRLNIANAELLPANASYLAEAVRCAGEIGEAALASELLGLAESKVRVAAEKLLAERATDPRDLSGDLRVEATWDGGADLDIALLDAEGHRISWLGAPTRALISARDVQSSGREALAVRGAAPGEYVLQVVRASGATPVNGQLTVIVAGTRRTVPFRLDGARTNAGIARISMESRLVPL